MSLSSILSSTSTDYVSKAKTADTQNVNTDKNTDTKSAANSADNSTGVVYEKTEASTKDSSNQIYNKEAIVAKLKADQESRTQSLQNLVEKLLNKQKGTFDLATGSNLASQFRQAASMADADTIKSAQEAISEDGYWGVNQTSDRLVSMAIALSGGDTDKADEMMAAIQKGYDKATKAWGEDLPDICKQTLEATKQKMEDWKNGKTTASDYSNYLS